MQLKRGGNAMLRFNLNLFSFVLMLTVGLWSFAGQADGFHYRYVSLDQFALPPPFTSFFPSAIQDSGRVYGSVCDNSGIVCQIAFYKDGTVTVFQSSGFAGPVNERGTVGGSVLVDPVNFIVQAALFRGDDVKLIPPQPGEVFASVLALNDRGTALVGSSDASGGTTYVLYSKGNAAPFNFGPTITNPFFGFSGVPRIINNEGIIAGTEANLGIFNGARGFRFDPRTGQAMLLNPFPGDPTETLAWGLGINSRGDVLGYSFVLGAPYHERIGVWDHNGVFQTYFVETISSSRLLFNDDNLIVISQVAGTHASYLVPTPGVRLNLADLVVNLPAGQDLFIIGDMNNHGDMFGFSSPNNNFLLQRVGEAEARSFATPDVKNARHVIRPVIAAMRRRLMPQINELK
ncbi:MAG: hypothetical protein ACREC9_05785 [Methylocella sp.]